MQVVAADQYDTWQASYSLPQLGDNVLTVTSRDEAGNQSEAVSVTVTLLAANQGDSTLVGLWHLDGSGTDYSGNGNHVALKNTAAFSLDSVAGSNSVNLNGIDDYLEKTSPSSVLTIGNQSWTVSAWIKTVAQNTDSMMIVERFECGWNSCSTSPDGNTKAWYKLSLDTGGKAAFYIRSDDNISTTTSGAQDIRDGRWHYIVGELDRSAGKARIYVDGAMRHEVNSLNGTISDAGSPLVIGKHAYNSQSGGTPEYFKGLIDEVAIYNGALTSDVVQNRYESGLASRVRPAAPFVNSTTSPTYEHLITLSGSKEKDTSLWVNGVEIVPIDSSTSWERAYFLQPGANILKVTVKNTSGIESDPVTATIEVVGAKDADSDIAALWHFDGSWHDYSGNANHLTPMNYADFTSNAQVGPAAGMFNENSSANRYARRASGTGLPLGGSGRTMAAWIKPYSYPDATYNGIVAYGQRACNQGSLLSIKNDGRLSMAFWCNDAYQTVGPSVPLNEWNHVAFVYAGGNKVKFYLNGRFVQESLLSVGTSAGSVPNTTDGPIRIGSTDDPGRTFNGLIDEAVIYKRAFSDLEMEKLYNQGAGRVGVWHMENTWDDASGNNNHGTAVGSAAFQAVARAGTTAGSFDGADGHVVGAAAKLPAGNAPRTVSAWVKAPSGNQDRAIFEYGTGSGMVSTGDFRLYIDAANLAAVGTGTGSNTVRSSSRLDDGRWHHLVGVYEGADMNTARIYVDGLLESSGTMAAPETVVEKYSIGAFLAGGGNYAGLLDDVIVYDYALSLYEIEKRYNEDLARVGYWPMDNSWADLSRNGNDGSAGNGAAFTTEPKIGTHAGNFDGVDDYVSVGNDADVLFTGPHTLESWVKFNGFPTEWAPISVIQPYRYGLYYNSVSKMLRAHRNAGSTTSYLDVYTTLAANTWYHFVQVFDGTDLYIYVNGQLLSKGPGLTGAASNASYSALIGRGWNASDNMKLQGVIDEVSLYGRALTADEIRENYNAVISDGIQPTAPQVDPVSSSTTDNTIGLSGTKQAGTSVWINGSEVVPSDDSTSWYTTYSLLPGTNVIYVAARSSDGSLSEPTPITVTVQPENQQDQDLVGLWHMDGSWYDYSGNGNHGASQNGASFTANAKMGSQAGSFDGSNDYVSIANSSTLHSDRNLTVTSWIFLNGFNKDWQTFYFKGNTPECTTNCENREYVLWLNKTGYLHLTSTPQDRVGIGQLSVNTNAGIIQPGRWYHIAAIISSDQQVMKIYVDGVEKASAAYSSTNIRTTSGLLIIGSNPYASSTFNGTIDELAIYKRALTAEEIERSYHDGLGRIGVWRMDNSWNDSSASLSHGTAYGYPAFVTSSRSGSIASSLDGVNDYVTGDAAKLPASSAPRTVSAWVKIDSSTQKRAILDYGPASGSNVSNDFSLYLDEYNHAVVGNGHGMDIVTGTSILSDGRWHFVSGVYEGPSTNAAKVYVDGVLESTGAITTPATPVQEFTIGRFLDNSGYFAGLMDELILYNRAITADEVIKYYNKDLGRVAYWRMDNNWQDSSGSNNTGTATNAGFSAIAKVGAAAVSFNGTNTYVANSSPAGLNLTTNFTIMGWINPATSQMGGIIDRAQENASGWEIWYLSNQHLSYGHNWNRSVGSEGVTTQPGTVPLNTWTQFAAVYTDKMVRLYINGWEVASKVFNNNPVVDGSEWVEIGVNRPGADEYFNGLIDEISIYNRPLTAEEILDRFNAENGGG